MILRYNIKGNYYILLGKYFKFSPKYKALTCNSSDFYLPSDAAKTVGCTGKVSK